MAGPSPSDTPPGDSPQASNLEGFLTGSYADFEDFLFNMAAEKSHRNVLMAASDPAEASESDLIADGLSSPWPELPNPYAALQEAASRDSLLTDPTIGLASLINAECLRTVSGDVNSLRLADTGIVSAFSKAHPDDPKLFTGRSGDVRFVISHTAAPVAYATDGWFERAGDSLSPDFVNLFRAGRNTSFAASLFNGEGVVAQSHPRDVRTIVSAHQLSRLGREPSRRFPKPKAAPSDTAPLPAKSPGVSTIDSTGTAVEVCLSAPAGVTSALDDIFASVNETRVWALLCLRTAASESTVSNMSYLRYQARLFGLVDLAQRRAAADLFIGLLHSDFVNRYSSPLAPLGITADAPGSPRDQISQVISLTNLHSQHALLGNQKIWLSLPAWRLLETELRSLEKENRLADKKKAALETAAANLSGVPTIASGAAAPYGSQNNFPTSTSSDQLLQPTIPYPSFPTSGVVPSLYGDDDNYSDYGSDTGGRGYAGPVRGRNNLEGSIYGDGYNGSEAGGDAGSDFEWQSELGLPNEKSADTELGKSNEVRGVLNEDLVEESAITRSRKIWVRTTWCLTWWIPSCCLSWRGMKRQDIQMAWREKVALCILIGSLSATIVFFIIGLSNIICPKDKLFSPAQVASHESPDDLWVSLRGKVYDITYLAKSPHGKSSRLPDGVSAEDMVKAVTLSESQHDVTGHFPIPLEQGCKGVFTIPAGTPPQVADIMLFDQNYTLFQNLFTPNAQIGHPLPFYVNDDSGLKKDRSYYTNKVLPKLNEVFKGSLAIELTKISEKTERNWFVYKQVIYDLTPLIYTQSQQIFNKDILSTVVDPVIVAMATDPRFFGQDVTETFDKKFDAESRFKNDPTWKKMNMDCLNNVFRAGILDERNTLKCQMNNYILLGASIVLVGVILIKFLAALQLGGRPTPEDHDKFVILQVPCYTEGEDSLKKTIDSLAALKYDDKRKLLFIICDGMIIGGGNDRPTPKIVLDLLGVDPKMDPEPLAFRSVGDGCLQHNFGKVYSGLYECEGHVVPYLVVVKVGKPSERARPGNRGKRDSQIILMRFLNNVHFDGPMSPLELEIYHQIKNVIGVHPSFYEYVLMVDADTEVMPDALNRLISTMLHDSQIVGLCGETQLSNEDRSWTTMIQVYEYYISHHLAKAFESLFGSVTCLPGCFCMYRIRSAVKGSPLIISTNIIDEYSECIVDTLHKKNLLSLGEDRYLTTLTMKHFPNYKMSFTPDAICKTVAPDKWEILLSQRRRWINSTIHNLAELIFLPELCGFCCFSMRFVVFIDLFGTLILPATVVYLAYLLYVVISGMETLPVVSLVMLVAVYGLQAIIFIVKRQWQHIGWMVIYILAIPVFSFALPIYAFWHFDDFSWGNTRVVVGDNKKQVFVAEEEKFDERAIPLRKWSDYEQELWEVGSESSVGSRRTAASINSYRSRESERSNRNQKSPRTRRPNSEYRNSGVYSPGSESGQNHRHSYISMATSHGTDYDNPLANLVPIGVDPNSFARNRPRPISIMSHHPSINPSDPVLVSSMSPTAASPSPAPQPTDEEVVVEIRHILGNENLMSLTKKQVREKLASFFGCDLTLRRDFINGTIEAILQGKM